MEFENISSAIESILFAVGEPVEIGKLANVLEINIDIQLKQKIMKKKLKMKI